MNSVSKKLIKSKNVTNQFNVFLTKFKSPTRQQEGPSFFFQFRHLSKCKSVSCTECGTLASLISHPVSIVLWAKSVREIRSRSKENIRANRMIRHRFALRGRRVRARFDGTSSSNIDWHLHSYINLFGLMPNGRNMLNRGCQGVAQTG